MKNALDWVVGSGELAGKPVGLWNHGAPAMRANFSGIGDRWVAVTLNEIAPKDEKGLPISRDALSDVDRKTVIDGLLSACDAADGVKDGMVFNSRSCRFDPKALVCGGAKTDGCLSAARAAALEKAFAGPKDSKGRQVYPAFRSTRESSPRRAFRDYCKEAETLSGRRSQISEWMWTRRSSGRSPIPARPFRKPGVGPNSIHFLDMAASLSSGMA